MVHDPLSVVAGSADVIREMAQTLAQHFASKAKADRKDSSCVHLLSDGGRMLRLRCGKPIRELRDIANPAEARPFVLRTVGAEEQKKPRWLEPQHFDPGNLNPDGS